MKLRGFRHSTYFGASFIGLVVFTLFGSYMYTHPQYDCNSSDFAWWANGTDIKTETGVLHVGSCKETMYNWFILSEITIVIGFVFPIGGIIFGYSSGEIYKIPNRREVE